MNKFKIFNLIGDVTPRMEEEFSHFIDSTLENPDTPILIAIDSPGGNTDIGFSIYNKIRAIPNPVYTLITGACHSIANIIFLAVPYERRFAFCFTSFFMHPASMCCSNGNTFTPSKLNEEFEELSEINNNLYLILKNEVTGLDKELIEVYIEQMSEFKLYPRSYEECRIAHIITKYEDIFKKEV